MRETVCNLQVKIAKKGSKRVCCMLMTDRMGTVAAHPPPLSAQLLILAQQVNDPLNPPPNDVDDQPTQHKQQKPCLTASRSPTPK